MAPRLPARSYTICCVGASCLVAYMCVCVVLLRQLWQLTERRPISEVESALRAAPPDCRQLGAGVGGTDEELRSMPEVACDYSAGGGSLILPSNGRPGVPAHDRQPAPAHGASRESAAVTHSVVGFMSAVSSADTDSALNDAGRCRSVSKAPGALPTLRDYLQLQHPAGKPRGFIYLLVELQRSSMLATALQSLHTYYNEQYQYPVVIFSEDPRMEVHLRQMVARRLLPVSAAGLYFYDISELWGPPLRVLARHRNSTARLVSYAVASIRSSGCLYPTGIGYWLMCRFQAKTVVELPFVKAFEYAWRLDADAQLCGPLSFDIFSRMKDGGYVQGYIGEDGWDSCAHMLTEFVQRYVLERNIQPAQGRASIEDAREAYIYNNFEIFKISFYLSEEYRSFIDFIDKTEGFFYYRWGDAPVRTQASRLFVPKEKMYEFKVGEVFYRHQGLIRCPVSVA